MLEQGNTSASIAEALSERATDNDQPADPPLPICHIYNRCAFKRTFKRARTFHLLNKHFIYSSVLASFELGARKADEERKRRG